MVEFVEWCQANNRADLKKLGKQRELAARMKGEQCLRYIKGAPSLTSLKRE